jgi:cytochrome c551/c552
MKKYFSFFFILILVFSHQDGLMAKSLSPKQANASNPEFNINTASSIPQDKDHGIGPVKTVELGPLNSKMISEGKGIFTNQCIVCHELDQKKLAPPLRNITKERTPEYIMNLLLNSAQMQKDDPKVKALLKEYNNLPMPDPALNQSKARSVLEYLRSVAK